MINLNNTTQKAQKFIDDYERANAITVCQLYKNPSVAKREAEREIRHRMTTLSGTAYKYRAWGAMPKFFTAGYLFRSHEDDKLYLIVETKSNTYKIDVEHLHEQI